MPSSSPPVFSRRSFIFFLIAGPIGLLTIFLLILVSQYGQYKGMVSPRENVPETVWTDEDREQLASTREGLENFTAGRGPDSLWIAPSELTLLAASSPTVQRQGIRFRITAREGDLVIETTQSIESMQGRIAWVFRKITPSDFRWLNARLEGYPEWKDGALAFAPERGYLNDGKVPSAALTKRGGMSPKDFLDPVHAPEYRAFLSMLARVEFSNGGIALIRN